MVYFLLKESPALEKVQKRATKLIPHLRDFDYESRLKHLNLSSLLYRRRRRADLLQVFRILLSGIDCTQQDIIFKLDLSSQKRGHSKKNKKPRPYSKIKQKTLGYRVLKDWNDLPGNIVCSDTLNQFKYRLETYWADVDFKVCPFDHF